MGVSVTHADLGSNDKGVYGMAAYGRVMYILGASVVVAPAKGVSVKGLGRIRLGRIQGRIR